MKKTIQTQRFLQLSQSFHGFIKVRNYRMGKGTMYLNALSEFLIWLEEAGIFDMGQVTSKESLRYVEYLTTRPKHRGEGVLSAKSIKFHLFVQGLFIQHLLESREIQSGYYIPNFGGGGFSERNTLSIEEIKTVYANCGNDFERALLSIAYGCGLRRSEISALDLKDVQITSGMVIVRSGKGSKRREVPMSDSVIGHLRQYINGERLLRLSAKVGRYPDAFFLTANGHRSSGEYLNDTLSRMIAQTGSYDMIGISIWNTARCISRHRRICATVNWICSRAR